MRERPSRAVEYHPPGRGTPPAPRGMKQLRKQEERSREEVSGPLGGRLVWLAEVSASQGGKPGWPQFKYTRQQRSREEEEEEESRGF